MSRLFVLLLLVLSVGLLGGSTCHFSASSGGSNKKKDDRRGSGVEVVVDTRTSTRTDGTGAGKIVAIEAALAASVMPLSSFEPAAAGTDPMRLPISTGFPSLASLSPPAEKVAVGAIPEPSGALLFATGSALLALRPRRRRAISQQQHRPVC